MTGTKERQPVERRDKERKGIDKTQAQSSLSLESGSGKDEGTALCLKKRGQRQN